MNGVILFITKRFETQIPFDQYFEAANLELIAIAQTYFNCLWRN